MPFRSFSFKRIILLAFFQYAQDLHPIADWNIKQASRIAHWNCGENELRKTAAKHERNDFTGVNELMDDKQRCWPDQAGNRTATSIINAFFFGKVSSPDQKEPPSGLRWNVTLPILISCFPLPTFICQLLYMPALSAKQIRYQMPRFMNERCKVKDEPYYGNE